MYLMVLISTGVVFAKKGNSQIMPLEGSKLNYTLAGFSVPDESDVIEYEFKVAKGSYNDIKQFEKSVSIIKKSDINKVLIQLPAFGTNYTWQVAYTGKKRKKVSKLYHFATDTSEYINTDKYRVRVVTREYPDSSLLFALDYARVIYNMKGEPVWFLPSKPEYNTARMNLRDIKMSPQNTLTFVTGYGAFELNKDGDILWTKNLRHIIDAGKKNLSRVQRESLFSAYHHDFVRTTAGTYMCLMNDTVLKKVGELNDEEIFSRIDTNNDKRLVVKKDGYYLNIQLGKLVEFDAAGNVKWQWRSSDHFSEEELFRSAGGMDVPFATTHMNAFFFNEKDSSVYIGFRNLSNIVRIKYPTNEVIASYGGGIHNAKGDQFMLQHSCRINADGDLYVFNNDVKGEDNQSKILVLKEDTAKGEAEVIWEFGCGIDNEASAVSVRGGNVVELSDGSMICCMGSANRVFIVNKEKKVLFNALSEEFLTEEQVWTRSMQYRVFPIDEKKYFNFIFDK